MGLAAMMNFRLSNCPCLSLRRWRIPVDGDHEFRGVPSGKVSGLLVEIVVAETVGEMPEAMVVKEPGVEIIRLCLIVGAGVSPITGIGQDVAVDGRAEIGGFAEF